MEIKKFNLFVESLARTDSNLPVLKRTKELNGADFLDMLEENCKNFSFNNTQLWRVKTRKYNFELFTPAPRNADPLAFKDFFNDIEHKTDEYPVVRKNSLIGGTDKEICKRLVDDGDAYLVIPFDDSEIVFCPIMDLWAMSDDRRNYTGKGMLVGGKPINKDNFTKVTYTENFQYLDKGKNEHGCEFFISSPCLLVHESKIDWVKKSINRE